MKCATLCENDSNCSIFKYDDYDCLLLKGASFNYTQSGTDLIRIYAQRNLPPYSNVF